jgi:5-methylthioadenosine/S-adenosylhomocysteine deaminase
MKRLGFGLAMALLGLAGCGDEDTTDPYLLFSEEENDNTVGGGEAGKADAVTATGYRSGCGAPIRTGTYTLKGDVITPTGVYLRGYVVVTDEKISSVRRIAPAYNTVAGMNIIDTGGVIVAGLIDGHGHVEYNHIPLADLGKRYQNRDQWPNAALYKTLVKDPKNAVNAAGYQCEGLRHGEIRALVGGTTAIQGTPMTSCVRPLVRNIEGTNFCQDRVRQNVTGAVGFNRSISGKPSFADSIKADLAADKLDAVVVHIAEGIDEHARSEWDIIKSLDLDIPELVMIHGTGLGQQEFAEAGRVGAKVVWSPLSNLLLYGKTTDVPLAIRNGVLVSLGSDWAPSGSANLLGELKVADRVNKKLWNSALTDEQLIQMVTINPAITFGFDQFVGSLAVGKYADVLVVKRQSGKTAYRAVIDAKPSDVLLVAISGDPLFGTQPLMDKLGKTGDYEIIDACGEPRAIDATVTASDVTKGTIKLAEIESKVGSINTKLTPVIDCTDNEALASYSGTPVQ